MSRAARLLASACALALFWTSACGRQEAKQRVVAAGAAADLAAHSAEFEPSVIEVTEGIHVAVGYGLANSILIEGDDGLIVVDTMESAEAARPVKAAFDAISTKPVAAIVYTHNHADHVFGAGVFAGEDHPNVYAHASLVRYLDRVLNVTRPAIFTRSMRQFGTSLPAASRVNAGIGPRLIADATTTPALIRPDRTFAGDRLEVTIAGVRLELVHAPGETPDQIFVWLPDRRVLLPGDNFYKSFPNLYAIRGTAYRDVMEWVASLDRMRRLGAEYLVPSHTRPIVGAAEIARTLTDYRDAIQYVHDQTVRAMNEGLEPEAIVERVKLPPHLASRPYLQEFYGRVDWSVRSIFAGYLGWFGGNATDLGPLPSHARAVRMAALAGGVDRLREQAREAADDDDPQWALELADHLLALDADDETARAVRVEALSVLGARQTSANARHYYLTQALETAGEIEVRPPDPSTFPPDVVRAFPIDNFMRAMPVNLDPGKSADADVVVGFRFRDTGETYTVHVRRGVAEVQDRFPDDPDVSVITEAGTWKEILAGQRSLPVALASGAVEVEGGVVDLTRFLLMFRPS